MSSMKIIRKTMGKRHTLSLPEYQKLQTFPSAANFKGDSKVDLVKRRVYNLIHATTVAKEEAWTCHLIHITAK